MEISITNIPEDKFQKISRGVTKILFENGIEDLETICVEEGCTEKFIGFEYEIKAN